MDEKIYDLLNNVQMNLDEYEKTELSSKEKQKIRKRLLREVRSMKKNNKKAAGKGFKIAGAVTAACMALSVIVIGSNPVEAKALFSEIYQKIISGSTDDKDADRIQELYTKIGEESVPVAAEGEGVKTEAEAENVKIKVSDVYCDGYMLYYTLQLETDNMELAKEEVDGIVAEGKEGTGPACTVWVDGEENQYPIGFEKQEDGTFVSVQDYNFFANENPRTYQNGDVILMEIDITALMGWDYENYDEGYYDEAGDYLIDYVRTETVNGQWKLSFPVTVETPDNQVQEINKEDNGVKILSVARGRATLNLVIEEPDYSKEPYNDPYNDPDMGIKGADGEDLQWLCDYNDMREDGTRIHYITLLDNGEENLCLEVMEKKPEEERKQIASIEFQVER